MAEGGRGAVLRHVAPQRPRQLHQQGEHLLVRLLVHRLGLREVLVRVLQHAGEQHVELLLEQLDEGRLEGAERGEDDDEHVERPPRQVRHQLARVDRAVRLARAQRDAAALDEVRGRVGLVPDAVEARRVQRAEPVERLERRALQGVPAHVAMPLLERLVHRLGAARGGGRHAGATLHQHLATPVWPLPPVRRVDGTYGAQLDVDAGAAVDGGQRQEGAPADARPDRRHGAQRRKARLGVQVQQCRQREVPAHAICRKPPILTPRGPPATRPDPP